MAVSCRLGHACQRKVIVPEMTLWILRASTAFLVETAGGENNGRTKTSFDQRTNSPTMRVGVGLEKPYKRSSGDGLNQG